jgi:hypothetical protein
MSAGIVVGVATANSDEATVSIVNKNFILNDFGFEKIMLSYISFDGSKVEMVTG